MNVTGARAMGAAGTLLRLLNRARKRGNAAVHTHRRACGTPASNLGLSLVTVRTDWGI